MAVGQVGVSGALDVPALDAVGDRLEALEVARSAGHAQVLRVAAELERLLVVAGMEISTVSDVALRLRCSEWRAGVLLEQARVLSGLPGGLAALDEGLLTVEQVGVFVSETARLSGAALRGVWELLVSRLRSALLSGEVLPPGRLTTLLRRWVLAVAPVEAVVERERAQAGRSVEVRRREDGLVDLFALGITAPNAHACLSRIQAGSARLGPEDLRTADQRRLDALVDLLTGRIALPLPGLDLDMPDADDIAPGQGRPVATPDAAGGGAGVCGCAVGALVPCGADVQVLVPCGADVQVLVPWGAALGTTDEVAELVGGGPLDPDLLRRLLLAAPRLRAVWVDRDGVPLATSSRTRQPRRDDPGDVRVQLLALAAQTPPPPEPRHPTDHPPDHPPGPPQGPGRPDGPPEPAGPASPSALPPAPSALPPGPAVPAGAAEQGEGRSRAHPPGGSGAHPPGTAGPYRVPGRLRRLLTVRRPLCEWPGCGIPARRCDMEHDVAWPVGPTCGCDVGPCCRRHHRVKQTGWVKTRLADGVRWTGPTGRSWWSPSPHQPPATPVRPLPALPVPDPLATLSALEWEHELAPDDPLLDGAGHSDRHDDPDPSDHDTDTDTLGRRLRCHDTLWTLGLADTQAWQDIPHPADR